MQLGIIEGGRPELLSLELSDWLAHARLIIKLGLSLSTALKLDGEPIGPTRSLRVQPAYVESAQYHTRVQ